MTSLFISHSSADRALADEVARRLAGFGYGSVFLDTDPEQGIPAGKLWERQLYRALRRSDGVIYIGTTSSAASHWCFAEVALARSLDIPVFALGSRQGGDVDRLLSDVQWIAPSDEVDSYERLLKGLNQSGLDPRHSFAWDQSRPPYPGLQAFAADDAAMFFGRESEIQRLTDLLHPTLARGAGRWVGIIGPSGSGKSSLLLAGLLPAMHRLSGNWVLVPPFVPGVRPTKELAGSLSRALDTIGRPRTIAALDTMVTTGGAESLSEIVRELSEGAEGRDSKNVLVSIDQAEELINETGRDEQQAFLDLLTVNLHDRSPLWVVCTLRSEFLSTNPERAGLTEVIHDFVVVEPLSRSRLSEVIARPARRAGLEFDPGLVERMVDETRGGDALPLLAYTLRELTKGAGPSAHIRQADYDTMGGVVGALQTRAGRLVDELSARGYADHVLPSLLKLVSVDPDGQPIRRRVPRRDLKPNEALIIDAFVEARLVTSSSGSERDADASVEVAHEALLRQWAPLREAIETSRASIQMRAELEREATDWDAGKREDSYLLRGGRLFAFEEWVRKEKPDLDERERRFLEASRALASREIERIRKSNRRLRQLLVGAAVLLLVATTSGLIAARQTSEARRQAVTALTRQLLTEASALRGSQPDLGVLLNVEAVHVAPRELRDDALVKLRQALNRPFHVTTHLLHHPDAVNAVAFNRSGSVLASASNDRAIRLWDARTGAQIGPPMEKHTAGVHAVSLSPADPGGRYLASASNDGTVRLWDTQTRQPEGEPFTQESSTVSDVTFSPDGKLLAAGTDDGALRLWNVATRRQFAKPLTDSSKPLWRVVFSPDGSVIAAASADGTIRLCDAASGGERGEPLRAHAGYVSGLAFNGDGSLLASAGGDGSIRLWNVTDGKQVGRPLQSAAGELADVAFSPDGSLLASGGRNGEIRLWNVSTRQQQGDPLTGHANAVRDLTFSPDGHTLVSASYDGTVRMWEVQPTVPGGTPYLHPPRVNDIAVSPAEPVAASVAADGTTRLWDLAKSEPRTREPSADGTAWLSGVAFNRDGTLLATASADSKLRMWNIRTGERHGPSLIGHTSEVSSVAFDSAGTLLASGSRDGDVRTWRVSTGEPLLRIGGHRGGVLDVAFRPDSSMLASAGQDGTVRVWDAVTGDPIGEPKRGHEGWVLTLAFSQNGIIASAGGDGIIRLWNSSDQGAVRELSGHSNEVVGLAFRADGEVLASVSKDGSQRLWDVASGRLIGEPLTTGSGELTSVAFIRDGFETVTADADGEIRVTSFDRDKTLVEACAIARRDLSPAEWRRYVGPARPYRTCMSN